MTVFDFCEAPVTNHSQVKRLDLFFIWLMKNYRSQTVKILCNANYLSQIIASVLTNPARARQSVEFKENQTIPRVYYEICFSSRGPYYKEHMEAKNVLRDLHKGFLNTIV